MRRTPRPMPFTEAQLKQVFATSIIDFALSNGLQLEKGDRATMHVKGLPNGCGGLYIFNHGRGYYWFSKESKGNIIDFAKDYFELPTKTQAIEMILGCRAYDHSEDYARLSFHPSEKEPKGELILPPKDKSFDRTITYLTEIRGIDREIVDAMIRDGKVYGARTQVEKDGRVYSFHNCTFVGYDETGKPRYCSLRAPSANSHFRQDVENSDKTYGFCMEGRSNRVYDFEAPIDAMSHGTLCKIYGIDWRQDHRVAEGCLSDKALYRYLQLHPEITEIVFCYDNDMNGVLKDGTPHNHGQIQAEISAETYAGLGYKTMILTPNTKDFNKDLTELRKTMAQTNALQVSEDEIER
ncbi:DUF3991 and TOPRIM domain-containing protein [Caproicibacter fermentans]|uniref:DUF3991 domain-containing protein n=1 Tax=Caproicibacter fermentans TaxID=2576756 RepID=A0A7G8TF15_9FIRM|nr:DUF3991 and TOPRIM domain-containing protein [Caproicibacter fermentans]QNK42206.1 DUF3991 domain-containing protein [Caproicibacter fermentans]